MRKKTPTSPMGPGALRRTLQDPSGFATIVELVPWAGALQDAKGEKPLKMAADLAGNSRITALSITDNAGGFAKLPPDVLGEEAAKHGHDVIVHVACRDRNRNAMQSLGWNLLSRGLNDSARAHRRLPGRRLGGRSAARLRHRLRGLLQLLREACSDEAVGKAAADGAPDPEANRFWRAVRSTRSSGSRATSSRSSSSWR